MNVNPLSAEELEELANDSVTVSYQIILHMFGRTVEFKAIFSSLAFQYFSFLFVLSATRLLYKHNIDNKFTN